MFSGLIYHISYGEITKLRKIDATSNRNSSNKENIKKLFYKKYPGSISICNILLKLFPLVPNAIHITGAILKITRHIGRIGRPTE